MADAWNVLHHDATMLFASVMLMVVVFLIARVAHAGQSLALTLAIVPTLLVVTVERGLLLGLI